MATNQKRYNVCCPREYEVRGEKRTHFWIVGTAFPLKEKDGFSCKLWTRVLPSDELVLLVHTPREERQGAPSGADESPPPDDDVPF